MLEQLQQFYANKRVLVTGGAGFIGSHLAEKLVALGAHVTVLDNFSSGTLSNLKVIAHAITLSYADIRSAYTCLKATTHKDIVFHCASFISVPASIQHPDLCYSVNIEGTKNLLEGCRKNNVQSFIFSSSSAVYGEKTGPCLEDDLLAPQTPYALSKRESEELCKEYTIKYNLNTASLRYFNVYGQRQNPNGPYAAVVAKFTQQLLTGTPLTIYGDGLQTRDFVHVSNVVTANLTLATGTNLNGEIFNIASGKSLTLFQLIEQLEQELKVKRAGIIFQPARQGDILHSMAHCDKYKQFASLG